MAEEFKLGEAYQQFLTDENREKFEQSTGRSSYSVTYKGQTKNYSAKEMRLIGRAFASKLSNADYAQQASQTYTDSSFDKYALEHGLPSWKLWSGVEKYAAGGGIAENYSALSDDSWKVLQDLWREDWKYGLTDEDLRRQANGQAPVEYDSMYTDSLLDDELKAKGLPPSKLLNGKLGEKYGEFMTAYDKHAAFSDARDAFYDEVSDKLYRAEFTGVQRGSEAWKKIFFDTLSSDKYADLWDYYAAPTETTSTSKSSASDTKSLAEKILGGASAETAAEEETAETAFLNAQKARQKAAKAEAKEEKARPYFSDDAISLDQFMSLYEENVTATEQSRGYGKINNAVRQAASEIGYTEDPTFTVSGVDNNILVPARGTSARISRSTGSHGGSSGSFGASETTPVEAGGWTRVGGKGAGSVKHAKQTDVAATCQKLALEGFNSDEYWEVIGGLTSQDYGAGLLLDAPTQEQVGAYGRVIATRFGKEILALASGNTSEDALNTYVQQAIQQGATQELLYSAYDAAMAALGGTDDTDTSRDWDGMSHKERKAHDKTFRKMFEKAVKSAPSIPLSTGYRPQSKEEVDEILAKRSEFDLDKKFKEYDLGTYEMAAGFHLDMPGNMPSIQQMQARNEAYARYRKQSNERAAEFREAAKAHGYTDFEIDNFFNRKDVVVDNYDELAHYREYLLNTARDNEVLTAQIQAMSDDDLREMWSVDSAVEMSDLAWTMALPMMAARGGLSYLSQFVNFADMLANNNNPNNDSWQVAQDLNKLNNFLSSTYRRDNQSKVLATVVDAGSELVRMYLTAQTGNAVGSALGAAFSWTSGGATIGQVLGDTKVAQGAAKLIEWGAESIPFITGAMGSSYAEARSKGATNREAALYGTLAGVVEGVTEKMGADVVFGKLGNAVMGKLMKSGVSKLLTGPLAWNTIKLACNAASEAVEEGTSYIFDLLLEKAIYNKDAKFSWQELGQEAGMGALCGAMGLAFQNYNATYVNSLMEFGLSSPENMQILMNHAMNIYGVNVGTDGNYVVKAEDYDETKILSKDALQEAWKSYLDANDSLRSAQQQYEAALASLDEDDTEKARKVMYWKNRVSTLDADDPGSAKALTNAMEQLVISERAQADTEKKNERLRAEARTALNEARQRGQNTMAEASSAIRGHSRAMVAATLNAVDADTASLDSSYGAVADDGWTRFNEAKAYTAAVSEAITALDELERASSAQREAKAALYGTAVATMIGKYDGNPVVKGALNTVNELATAQEAEAVRLEETADGISEEIKAEKQRQEQRTAAYHQELDLYDSWYNATIDEIDAEEQETARAAANGEITAAEYEAAKAKAAAQIASAIEARDMQRREATLAYAGAGGETGGLSALRDSLRLQAAEARDKADAIRNSVVRAMALRTQSAAFAALDEILTGDGVLTAEQRSALSDEMNKIVADALGSDAEAQKIYDAIATAEAAAETDTETNAEEAPAETASEATESTEAQTEEKAPRTAEEQRAELQKALAMGKMLGVNVQIAEDLPDTVAGKYSPTDDVLYINKNTKNAPMRVLVHELTHHLEGTTAYEKLEQYIFGTLSGDPSFNLDTEIACYRTLYAEARTKMGRAQLSDADATAEARAEIVARWCENNLFTNEKSIQNLTNSQQGLAKRILSSIQSMLSGNRQDPAAATLAKAERLYIKALNAAKAFDGQRNERYSVVGQLVASGMYVEQGADSLTAYRVRYDKKGNRTLMEPLTPNYENPVDGPVTTDDILNHSPIGAFIRLGQKNGTIEAFNAYELDPDVNLRAIDSDRLSTAGRMTVLMTDLANMCLAYKDNNFAWSMIGGYVFSAITSNSDPQYSRTIDFGTICRKTQNLVTAMSNAMKEKGRGLYAEEIIELQNKMINGSSKIDAPCSMCYVFSRWLGLGGYLNRIKVYQDRYSKMTPEQVKAAFAEVKTQLEKIVHPAAGEGNYEALVRDLAAKHGLNAENYLQDLKRVGIAKSNNRYGEGGWVNAEAKSNVSMSDAKERSTQLMEDAQMYARLLEDCLESYDGKNIKDENRRKAYEEIQQRMELTDAYGWLTKVIFDVNKKTGDFTFRRSATADGKTWTAGADGNPSFVVPTEILFDLNASDKFATDYPDVWSFRCSGGSALGKATYGYTDARLGEITYGASVKSVKSQQVPKAPRYGVNDQSNRKALPKNKLSYVNWGGEFDNGGEKTFKKAMGKIKAQGYKGGERMQSSSDFTSRNALDYLLTAFEMQCLGATSQVCSKVPEGISFFGSIGASNNISCIGKGKGYKGTPTWTFDKASGRYKVNAGSGELVFSTIQGVDPEIARALATVNNSSQIITVAMNREHAALLISTPWIHMIIPVHMSGGTVENISARAVAQGDPALVQGEIHDATDCQTDKAMSREELAEIKNEDGSPKYTKADIDLMMKARKIRADVLYGKTLSNEDEALIDVIDARFTGDDHLFRNMVDDYRARKITMEPEKDVVIGVNIYPAEYWDTTSTIDNADVNGDRFQTYCEMLGVKPRFSYGAYGEQGKPGDPDYFPGLHKFEGYWKSLIDREMYNTWGDEAGTFRAPTAVDISRLSANMLNGTAPTSVAARLAAYYSNEENRSRAEKHFANTYDKYKLSRPNTGAYMFDAGENAKILQQETAAAQVGREYGRSIEGSAEEAKNYHDRLALNSDVDARLAELRKQYGAMTTSGAETAPGREDVVLPKQTTDDTYVRRAAQTFMRAQTVTDAAASEIGQAVLRGEYNYERQTNEETRTRAEQMLVDLGGHVGALNHIKNVAAGHSRATAETVALGEQLILDAMQTGDTNAFEEAVAYTAMIGTIAGQTTQAFSMINKLSPQGVALYLHKVIERLNNVEYKDLIAKGKMQKIELTEDQTARILGVKSFSEATAVQTQILKEIGEQIPVTMKEQLRNWRYLCMLGNVRTNVRNLAGNLAMASLQMSKNTIAAGLEALDVRRGAKLAEKAAAASRAGDTDKAEKLLKRADRHLGQSDRTKALRFGENANLYEANLAYAKGTTADALEQLKGGGKDVGLSALQSGKRMFNAKWLNKIGQTAMKPLDVGDLWFSKPHYEHAYAQWMTAKGLTGEDMTLQQRNEAMKYAVSEAQKATFRDANWLATKFTEIRSRNLATEVLVGGVLPFAKTPANILKRGIEYSPAGIIEGIAMLRKADVSEDMSRAERMSLRAQALDRMSSGATGTGLMALGIFLRAIGALRGKDKDDRANKFLRDMGQQDYSFKIGSVNITLDWLAPMNMPMFMGVAMWDVAEQLSEGDELDWKDIAEPLLSIADPLIEMSLLSGIQSALKTYGSENTLSAVASNTLQSFAGQFYPTIGGQIARTVDLTRRQPDSKKYWAQSMMAKIPGLSKLVKPYVGGYGEEEEFSASDSPVINYTARAFEQFILPGYVKVENREELTKELTRVYESTGVSAFLPSKPSDVKTINLGKELGTMGLTYDQQVEYEKLWRQTAAEALRLAIKAPEYAGLTDADKADLLTEVYSLATKDARKQYKLKLVEEILAQQATTVAATSNP